MVELRDLCHVKDLLATVVQVEAAFRQETGLNLNQSFALCCLARGPMTAGALAEELRIHGASLSRIIKVLAQRGYIHRDLNEDDSRQKVLSLTEEGKELAQTLAGCETRLFPLPVGRRGLVQNR